ncbi:Nif3-like dinuclear metal center hexameric protein, partial [Campylobacter lari]|nr:Nif3-like dinuclear metal center hexameric protein [Campylobacter lari]
MKIKEIYDYLDTISPFSTQSSWDNSGLLLGTLDQEVNQIYLALDVDIDLVENASENSLFIVHHPLIFKGLKHLSGVLYPQNILTKMIQKNIALIAMHTNFDLSHLNAYFAHEILGF